MSPFIEHAQKSAACDMAGSASNGAARETMDPELLEGRRQAALHHAMDLLKASSPINTGSPAAVVVEQAKIFERFLSGEPKPPPPVTLAQFTAYLAAAGQIAEAGPYPRATITVVSHGFLISACSGIGERRAYLSFEQYSRTPDALIRIASDLRQAARP